MAHAQFDKTWAFIEEPGRKFVCLFNDEPSRYLFLVDDYHSKLVDGVYTRHFNGTLYRLPEDNILREYDSRNLLDIITSERLEHPPFVPEHVMEVSEVPNRYVQSLEKYVHDYLME